MFLMSPHEDEPMASHHSSGVLENRRQTLEMALVPLILSYGRMQRHHLFWVLYASVRDESKTSPD